MSLHTMSTNDVFRIDNPSKVRVHLSITRNCNLNCDYCCVPSEKRALQSDVARHLIDWLADLFPAQLIHLVLLGGEPLLFHRNLIDYIPFWRERARARGKKIIISLITNGTLIESEMIEWLCNSMDSVSISIDGTTKIHNHHRKYCNCDGTYDDVVRSLKKLLLSHPRVGTISVITRDSIRYLSNSLQHVVSIGARNIFYQPLFPPSENWKNDDMHELKKQLLAIGRSWIDSQYTTHPFRMLSWHGIFLSILQNTRYQRKCSRTYLSVSEEGDVYHCQDLEILSAGYEGHHIPKATVLHPPDDDWLSYWHVTGSADCQDCQVTELFHSDEKFYPSVINKVYRVEEAVCREILPEIQDEGWFHDFLRLQS